MAQLKPVYPPLVNDESTLIERLGPLLTMSEKDVLALVPPQGGFMFSDCPHCKGGTQEYALGWDIAAGDKAQCMYCKMLFPNDQYPENGQVEAITPTGKKQIFKYHQDNAGKKYWFESRCWFEQRLLLEKAAYNLAQLYRLNPEKHVEAGRRAAAIIKRFAEVYPDYVPKYDYPGQEKYFSTKGDNPAGFEKVAIPPYRLAKWSWWAYMDVSDKLLRAYDQLVGSDFLSGDERTQIETKLFGAMLDYVAQYRGTPLHNMDPTLWEAEAVAARILKRPKLADEVIAGARKLVHDDFTEDGFWKEPTVSYHLQTANGLQIVLNTLYPELDNAARNAMLQRDHPDLARALNAADALRLPNGHYAAINDTWAKQSYGPAITESKATLLPGLGHGILGMGQGDGQLQAHLSFNGRFGHDHYGSLNLILFAQGKELLSDIGYSHTSAREFACSTVAHNTVVVDEESQVRGEAPNFAKGKALLFSGDDPDFQAVEATAPEVYGSKVSDYRRALVAVQAPGGGQYVVDIFHVAGGNRHDWVLHGSADEEQNLTLSDNAGGPLALQPLKTLLPEGFKFERPTIEGSYKLIWNGPWAYGYLENLAQGQSNGTVKATFAMSGESNRGLQTYILNDAKSTFITAKSWAIRGAKEEDAKLNDHWRQDLIVRREGPKNRFVAVHVPFVGTAPVEGVSQLPWSPDGVALKIEYAGGVDYVIYQPEAKMYEGKIEGQAVQFDGRIALIRVTGKQVQLKSTEGQTLKFANSSK